MMSESVVPRWWSAPGGDTLPPLSIEIRMGRAAVDALLDGASAARARKSVAHRFPLWAHLAPELVDAVIAELSR
jgi:hypothetical protein